MILSCVNAYGEYNDMISPKQRSREHPHTRALGSATGGRDRRGTGAQHQYDSTLHSTDRKKRGNGR